MQCHRFHRAISRRDMLRTSASGFGQIALAALAGRVATAEATSDSVQQTIPHLPARAKRIIFLFMWGGPSHVDLFDPKPQLNAQSGKPLAGKTVGSKRDQLGTLLGSPFRFAQHGEGGIWISELFPHLASHADKLCVIRSLHTEGSAHGEALLRLHTGQANLVRPSVGAWVSYGLGSESDNLPGIHYHFSTARPRRRPELRQRVSSRRSSGYRDWIG